MLIYVWPPRPPMADVVLNSAHIVRCVAGAARGRCGGSDCPRCTLHLHRHTPSATAAPTAASRYPHPAGYPLVRPLHARCRPAPARDGSIEIFATLDRQRVDDTLQSPGSLRPQGLWRRLVAGRGCAGGGLAAAAWPLLLWLRLRWRDIAYEDYHIHYLHCPKIPWWTTSISRILRQHGTAWPARAPAHARAACTRAWPASDATSNTFVLMTPPLCEMRTNLVGMVSDAGYALVSRARDAGTIA